MAVFATMAVLTTVLIFINEVYFCPVKFRAALLECLKSAKKEGRLEKDKDETICEFKKGDILFKEGDLSKEMYIVQKGIVKIYKNSGESILPIALVHSGQFVGELSFFDGKPRSASAEALTNVEAVKLDKKKLERELARLPRWLSIMIDSIAARVRDADEIIKRNEIVDERVSGEFDRWSHKSKEE